MIKRVEAHVSHEKKLVEISMERKGKRQQETQDGNRLRLDDNRDETTKRCNSLCAPRLWWSDTTAVTGVVMVSLRDKRGQLDQRIPIAMEPA